MKDVKPINEVNLIKGEISEEKLVKELDIHTKVMAEILQRQVEEKTKKLLTNPSAPALSTTKHEAGVGISRVKKTVKQLFILYLTNQFVSRATNIRADTIISMGYDLVEGDEQGIKSCWELINNSGGPSLIWETSVNAYIAGDSFLEKTYNLNKTKILKLKQVHPLTLSFKTDKMTDKIIVGEDKQPIGYVQYFLGKEGIEEEKDVPKDSIAHFKFNTLGDEFTGISLFQSGYDTIVRLMNMEYSAAEAAIKTANPLWVVECNTKSPHQIAQWALILGKITGKDQLFVPEGMKLEMRSPGAQNFSDYADYFLNAVVAGCYDDKTEILTDEGWKLFKELDKTEKVAQVNKDTLKISYVKPTEYIEFDYNGYLYDFKNKFIDLSLTPEHRVLYINQYNRKPYIKSAEEIYNKKYSRILMLQAGFFEGKKIETLNFKSKRYGTGTKDKRSRYDETSRKFKIKGDLFCEFMGLFLGDGWTEKANDKISIVAYDNNPDNILYIKDVLNRMGVKYHDYFQEGLGKNYNILGSKSKGSCNGHKFWFSNSAFSEYLKQFGKAGDKFVPKEIKNATQNQIEKFLIGYWRTDGSGKNFEKGIGTVSISERLTDDIQELFFKIGRPSTKNIYKARHVNCKDSKSLCIRFKERYGRKNTYTGCYRNSITKRKYKGKVYCVTVPESFLVVRRNGRICISGNSGVPKGILLGGTSGSGNRAQEIVLSRHYYSSIRVDQRYLEDFFNGIFKEYGEIAGFKPPKLVFNDIAEDAQALGDNAIKLFQAGIISLAESREMVGLGIVGKTKVNRPGQTIQSEIKKSDKKAWHPSQPGSPEGSQKGEKTKMKQNPYSSVKPNSK